MTTNNGNVPTACKRAPPKFTDGMLYKTWRNKIEMWELVTNVPLNKRGIIVLLDSLEGNAKAEKAVVDLSASQLNNDGGLNVLFAKLDLVYKEEAVDEAYNVYSKFINFSKSDEMNMTDYILEFEHLYNKMIEHEMKLPNTVLTFKLLDGAKISDDERKLVLTFCSDLQFEKMKSASKRLFKTATAEQSTNEVNLKQEEAFYTKRHYKDKKFKSVHNEKLNALDKNGKVSKCVICRSKMHWANKCPHRSEQNVNILEDDDDDNIEEINIVLMTEKLSKTEILVAEASKSAVIDTACTKTIAGEKWFINFKSNLTDDSIKNTEIYQSNTKFKFGDGQQVTATKRVIFPIVIAGKHCRIEAEIVKENIPLLLSKTSLKRCNMIIDLPNDKAKVFKATSDTSKYEILFKPLLQLR